MREHIVLATDTYEVVAGEVHRGIALSDPGIDDYRNDLLWSPHSPTLIDAFLELRDEEGRVIDRLQSYTALRSVNIQGDKFILNGRPLILRLVLDQGYWPDSGSTAPDDQALLHDVLLAKVLGFNGVRKHQKIECQRYLYWADRMGLLVWEEMPSAYRYTTRSVERLTAEWTEVIRRDSQPPVHYCVGTLQRVVGCAGSAGQPGATALRTGALPSDEVAGFEPAGGGQRWVGEYRYGHYRDSRL